MDKLDNILCKVFSSWDCSTFLSSDININVLRETSISKSYITILENDGLGQVVTKSTRNGLKSTDHIITNHGNITIKDTTML